MFSYQRQRWRLELLSIFRKSYPLCLFCLHCRLELDGSSFCNGVDLLCNKTCFSSCGSIELHVFIIGFLKMHFEICQCFFRLIFVCPVAQCATEFACLLKDRVTESLANPRYHEVSHQTIKCKTHKANDGIHEIYVFCE